MLYGISSWLPQSIMTFLLLSTLRVYFTGEKSRSNLVPHLIGIFVILGLLFWGGFFN